MSWADVENKNNNEGKIPYTKFESGNTIIRALDNEPYSFWQHYMAKQKTAITCPGKDCPICNIIAQAKANREQAQYTNSQRHAIRIWNYTTNQMEVMIQGRTFFSQLLDLHKEVGDITTYDIKVIRKGEGMETTYTLLPQAPKPLEITEGIENVNMEEYFKTPEREVIMQLIEGKTWDEINNENAA